MEEKKAYTRPELVEYGTLGGLTQHKTGDTTDGHNQVQNMHFSGGPGDSDHGQG